jgi:hypothetical protein
MSEVYLNWNTIEFSLVNMADKLADLDLIIL